MGLVSKHSVSYCQNITCIYGESFGKQKYNKINGIAKIMFVESR
jgi:hypothetical protein